MIVQFEIIKCAEEPLSIIYTSFEGLDELDEGASPVEVDLRPTGTFISYSVEASVEFDALLANPRCYIDHYL